MIKLDTLSRWQALPTGQVLTLTGDTFRRIRLNVNSPGRALLYVLDEQDEPIFLAAPDGRDVVEFAAGGTIRLATTSQDVFCQTAENEPTFTVIENAEVFTQIAERAARNPDMEHLLYLQQLNMERRIQQITDGMEARLKDAYHEGRETVIRSDAPGTAAPLPVGEGAEQDAGSVAPGATGGEDEPAGS